MNYTDYLKQYLNKEGILFMGPTNNTFLADPGDEHEDLCNNTALAKIVEIGIDYIKFEILKSYYGNLNKFQIIPLNNLYLRHN